MSQPPQPDEIRTWWEEGELGYRLRNIQKKARQAWELSSSDFLKFYLECTRRLGKSTYGLIWLTEDCIKNPGSVSAFFAPIKDGLRDYILPIIDQTFSDCPDDLKPVLDSSLTLTFPNGSKIIFRGSNNQTHRTKRGNAFRRVYIDEARDVDDLDNLVDSVVMPSLFSTVGRLMIGSTPADTEDHPLFAIKQQCEKDGTYFHCSIYDANRYDPADFPLARIEQWKRETNDPVAWAREYEAKWVKDPTKTIIPEWDDAHEIAEVPRDDVFPYYHKYCSLDSGVTDKTAGLLAFYNFREARLYVEAEFTLRDSEVRTDRIAQIFKEKEIELGYQARHDRKDPGYRHIPDNEKVYRRVADNNNLILVNDLNSLYDLDFFPTRKDELAAMINLVREWVKDGKIKVSTACPELLGCFRNAVWDKKREKLAKSKVYGHFDALMALVYMVRNVDTSTNPVPKYFGKSYETHSIPTGSNHPQTQGEKLAAIFGKRTGRDQAREDFTRGRIE